MSRKTRKLIWSAPLVAVLAVAGALAIFAAQMPGTALAHDLPGAVENLDGKADGTMAVNLSWDPPSEGGVPTHYRIDRSDNGNRWMMHKTIEAMPSPSHKDSGLDANTTYYYRVFGINSAGTGLVSRDILVQTKAVSAPGRVTGLAATANGQNKVDLSWTAPSNNGGADVMSYQIHFAGPTQTVPVQTVITNTASGVDPGVRQTEEDDDGAANRTTYTVDGLTANTRYRFVVYAVNAKTVATSNKSALPSNTAAATTAKLQKPAAPKSVTAIQTAADDTDAQSTIKLYWIAPDGDKPGGNSISDYKVEVSVNGGDYVDADTVAEQGEVVTSWATATSSVDATYTQNDGTFGTSVIKTVQFRVYTMTDDDGTANGTDNEMTSATGTSSNVVTLVTDPDGTGDVTTTNQLARLIPDEPGTVEFSYDDFGEVKGSWVRPLVDDPDDLTDNAPKSIGGYRIDVSSDGMSWQTLVSHTRKTAPEFTYVAEEKETLRYRVFAWHSQYLGEAQEPTVESEYTPGTDNPDHVAGLRVTVVSPSQIDVSWDKLTNTGSSPFKEYEIYGVKLGTANTFANWLSVGGASTKTQLLDTSKIESYSHEDLSAGDTWKYRVIPVSDNATNPRPAVATEALEDQATTPQAQMPEVPEGLTAENAKDSNLPGASSRGVLLLWNAPNPPDGANIDGYRIRRKTDDGAWETLATKASASHTDYTDTKEPKAGETRMYQVAALNGSILGAWSNTAYYPHALTQPGKPTLSAMKDTDMPGTKVKLTWTAPAMNANLVTGYIIERRHAGDMMGDIPSDGYNDGVMGRSFAFSNHMEWWETLNCKGMLAAAGSDADPTMDSADKTMYCAHYAMTKPTNMAGTITAGSDVDMKIKEMFMNRYVTDDMGKTKTMFTGMMHTDMGLMDMGLMENTEYTYRIRAIHGMKAGMWSDKAMVTTGSDNNDPMKFGTIAAVTVEVGETSDPMDVSMYFRDADMDDLTYRAMSDDEMIATVMIDDSMLTITGVAEDTATVTVYASDGKGGTDAMQTIAVTVTSGTLTPPTNVKAMVEVDDEDPGNPVTNVIVTWNDGAHADVHDVYLISADFSIIRPERIEGIPSPETHTFRNVAPGKYVGAVRSTSPSGEASRFVFDVVTVPEPAS